jgi:hypothetical protein
VRQTTVLIAQLSTAAGIRSPLAHVAHQIFIEIPKGLEAQGLAKRGKPLCAHGLGELLSIQKPRQGADHAAKKR